MKHLIVNFSTLLLICTGFILTSCKKDDPLRLEVASGDLYQNFNMNGVVKSVAVTANVQFIASVEQAAADWCSATAGNATVSITVAANTGASRTATVTLSATGVANVEITVTQDTKPLFMTVEEAQKTLQFGGDGGETTVIVNTDAAVNATLSPSDAGWCRVAAVEGGIKIMVTKNEGSERSTTVTLSAEGVSETVIISVMQNIAPIPGKVFDACESIAGRHPIPTLDGNDKKEGNYSLRFENTGTTLYLFRKDISPSTFDPEVTIEKGYIAFDLFISDIERFGPNMRFDLTSSGTPDANRLGLNTTIEILNLKNGWNSIEWCLTGPPLAPGPGSIQLNAINQINCRSANRSFYHQN